MATCIICRKTFEGKASHLCPDCPPSSCTVDSIVVPRELWDRTVSVIKTIRNSRKGSCGSVDNVYCPGPMNRHRIDNLMNEIQGTTPRVNGRREGTANDC